MRIGVLLAVVGALAACASKPPPVPDTRQPLACGPGQAPCGTGCRPTSSTCCDDGTGKTSSYCDGAQGCFLNTTRGCTTNGAPSAFCCGASGTTGSDDCAPGEHHCGATCIPLDAPCCTGSACTTLTTAAAGMCAPDVVLCGVCQAGDACRACESGACCSGDVCANTCVKGDACTVPPAPKTGCDSSADCAPGKVCASSRRCASQKLGDACVCSGDFTGTCVDFAARNVSVSACGACGADWSACCPGTECVDGQCKASCP